MDILKGMIGVVLLSILPIGAAAAERVDEAEVEAAFTTLKTALQEELQPNSVSFDAARRLIALDAWSILDESQLQRIENCADAPVDVAWTMAARWYFDPVKRQPWLDQLQSLARAGTNAESLTALRALMQLQAVVPSDWSTSSQSSPDDIESAQQHSDDDQAWLQQLRQWRTEPSTPHTVYALALNAFHELSPEQYEQLLRELAEHLSADSVEVRRAAAWTMRYLPRGRGSISSVVSQGLAQATDERMRIELAAALITHTDDSAEFDRGMAMLTQYGAIGDDSTRAKLYQVELAGRFGAGDQFEWLKTLRATSGPSSRVALAAAESEIRWQRRQLRSLGWLDWLVIGVYGLGMIVIGWYYSRRTANTEDYLLGGRRMSPVMVGLSMFASLLSTLTFLAQPGEVIRNGPMTLVQVVSYPFVFLVVGWLLIPSIMRMRVTSGYEMLEAKLGLSSRLLGAMIFLTLRVLWMATIIYVTTSAVLIPMLGWTQAMTPVVCAAIGIVTIIYTSMGGLRAVVVTDAAQTIILFGGALLAILLISIDMGGIDAWWPKQWYPQWQEPEWWDPSVRTSFAGLFLAMFSWQVCTTGSDQMAIQRFAATRDIASARRVLWVSLATSGIVFGFLVCLGLALLAYFQNHPEYIPDQQRLFGDSDKMLPAFIIRRMPVGVSGLVIAGLLAAAMSSLSSGVNSSCSVITTDLIDRCRHQKLPEDAHIRIAKWVSVLLGGLVVALSLFVSVVPGNIFELCFKIANLLVGPLFLLFFLAIFVRRANALSAWIGVIFGTLVAIAIGFGEQLFGSTLVSFVWLTPASFVAGLMAAFAVTLTNRRSD